MWSVHIAFCRDSFCPIDYESSGRLWLIWLEINNLTACVKIYNSAWSLLGIMKKLGGAEKIKTRIHDPTAHYGDIFSEVSGLLDWVGAPTHPVFPKIVLFFHQLSW